MKYYSDLTKKFYETEKACTEAEAEHQKKLDEQAAKEKQLQDERAARAKEVESAYYEAVEATKKYQSLLDKFIKDYQSYHMTIRRPSDLIGDLFTSLWTML